MILFKHCQSFSIVSTLSKCFLVAALCLCSLFVKAQEEEKVSVRFDRDPLAAALEKLQRVSSFSYTYNADQLPKERKVTAVFEKAALSQVLNAILKETGFTYKQQGNYILIVPAAPAAPKKSRTTVTGRILDEENGEPVIGATVRINGLQLLSDGDGAFVLALPLGKYEADISSIGYSAKRLTDIEVTDDKGILMRVTLKREKGQLQGITVSATARRESVAGLYIAQKNRASISDGISAEQISRTPDKNVGESLKRVSGVTTVDNKFVVVRGLGERYNGAILNGQLMPSTELNRKQFSFDIIPANLIEHVVVHKTITPEMSAEFGGGLVAVQTQTIPTENFLTIAAGVSVNDKTTGKSFTGLQIENKQYFGAMPDNRKLMGRNDWGSRAAIVEKFDPALFPNNWALHKYTPLPSQNFQVSGGKIVPFQQNRKLGLIGAVSYRNTWQTQDMRMTRNGYDGYEINPDGTKGERAAFHGKRYGFTANMAALGGISYQTPLHKITLQSLFLQTLDQQLVLGQGVHESVEQAAGYYDLFTHTRLWQHQVRSEHLLGKKGIKLNLLGSYSRLNRQKPDNHVFNAKYVPDGGKDTPDEPVDFSIKAAQAFGVDGALRTWNKAMEDTYNWSADLTIPFALNLGGVKLKNNFKTGYNGWAKQRYFWVVNTGSGYNENYFQPITEYFDSSLHPNGRRLALDEFGDDMNKKAKLHAGYLMMDNRIGKLRMVWGLRAEYYQLNDINVVLDSLFADINRGRGGNNQFDYSDLVNREPNMRFFPSANLTYSLTSSMNLRLAYAKSIIRPDLREMSFFREYDFELGGEYQSDYLQSTVLHNYDFRYEWYPAAGELLSFSLFYKKLDYPMEIYKIGDNRLFKLRNNKKAINKGIEVEIRKSLAFTKLPVLKNITLYGNGTLLDSKVERMSLNVNLLNPDNPNKVTPVETEGPTEKRPQAGASNYMANAGLYYDARLFSLSFNYNYVSNRLVRPTDDYVSSLFEQPLNALDAQVAFNLMKQKMKLRFTVSNLLNARSIVYSNIDGSFKDPKNPTTKEFLYQEGDPIDYEARPGRTFSISIGYRF
jgi:outer membrane receptor protein involved in Fe transport